MSFPTNQESIPTVHKKMCNGEEKPFPRITEGTLSGKAHTHKGRGHHTVLRLLLGRHCMLYLLSLSIYLL